MSVEQRRKAILARIADEPPVIVPMTALTQLDHLLKVAGSIAQDANKVWAEMWAEYKHLTTGGGMVVPEAKKGFVPQCGWPEFLEKFWLLKHYLDSVQRICERKH
jgi:hypothetical protein